MKLYTDPYEEEKMWEIRESGLGATARVPGDPVTWEGWEDSAVPPHQVGIYLRALRKLFNKFGYACSLYGHFGDGCIHTRIDFGLKDKSGIEKYQRFVREAAAIVSSFGGSISGEHGDGQSKADLLPIMFGPELVQAFHEFKQVWDPWNRMNPGKIVNAFHNDENLRLGAGYNPWQPQTKFFYAEDGGNFAESMLRCVGVGKCRHAESGTMCPSYMVTREEKHTTRGRARLLFEMLQGEVIRDGWKSKEVREGLDLCLSCKGCQSDCPMHVDMATYKAEFLSHYYQGRLRPRTAYAMGLIRWWARVASKMPRLVNFLGKAPVTGTLMKWIAGISQERKLPQFAKQTFREWWAERAVERGRPARQGQADEPSALLERGTVLLWVDTFNNHFHPEILQAAVEVLEATGHRVILPEQKLCCGRPLYDYGMLDLAKKLLGDILVSMRKEIRDEVPVIGLEPSCVAVFRDELKRLFPFDEDARRLCRNVMTFAEFFVKRTHYEFPKLVEQAVVHGHCHQKAVMKMDAETELYKRLGLEFEILDTGCCGMAGSFGFEADHYEVSVKCGERMLLPIVRDVKEKKLIIADGFSCREQIEQLDGHRALHTVEVVLKALRQGSRLHPEGKNIRPQQTVPEMQEQTALKNRRRAEPMETE